MPPICPSVIRGSYELIFSGDRAALGAPRSKRTVYRIGPLLNSEIFKRRCMPCCTKDSRYSLEI